MIIRHLLALSFLLIAFPARPAIGDDKTPRRAITIDEYHETLRLHKAKQGLQNLGIDEDAIHSSNLGFSSNSYAECVNRVLLQAYSEDEYSIAVYACLKRHPNDAFDNMHWDRESTRIRYVSCF